MSKPALTPRQAEALEWLHRVGKATRTTCRRHGFQTRTLDVLVKKGLATVEFPGHGWHHTRVYRPVAR